MPKLHHSRHTIYCALLLQISGTYRICLNARSSDIHMQSWFMCWTPLICWYVKFWVTVVVHIAMMSLKLDFSPSLITLDLRCGWNLSEENAYIKTQSWRPARVDTLCAFCLCLQFFGGRLVYQIWNQQWKFYPLKPFFLQQEHQRSLV
jgi:hypothetical protein